MPDLSFVAMEAAEQSGHYPETMLGNRQLQRAYALGLTECASRLPSGDELAAEMKRHHFAANMLDNITWGMWMSQCECGWESPEFRYPGESIDAYYAHAAQAALALIGEKIIG